MYKRVNSKATLRVPLGALLNHIPTALHAEISRSRYVAAKSNDIIVQADDSRKQNDNAHACYKRLYDAIVEAGHNAVPNETSAEQMRHVKNLWVMAGVCTGYLLTTLQTKGRKRAPTEK